MRVVLLVSALAATALPVAAPAPAQRVSAAAGLSVVLPPGWRLSHARVAVCSEPEQRFVAATGRVRLLPGVRVPPRAAVVLLMEGSSGRFRRRPAHFTLPALANLGGCCDIPVGRGAELLFRDHGRRFYAFVYVGKRARRNAARDVERLLDSLLVSRRR